MRIKYLEFEVSRKWKTVSPASKSMSLLAVAGEICNLTEVNIVSCFLLSRCPPFFACQDAYIVPTLKCINVTVLIGIFVRCISTAGVSFPWSTLSHCSETFYLKAAPRIAALLFEPFSKGYTDIVWFVPITLFTLWSYVIFHLITTKWTITHCQKENTAPWPDSYDN